ncbi:MAG TPA: glycosyltransferase family 1 protein [Steroidobacteraceae bacterium]|jgi:glycosyltransferase involved in cell wall biosynthesis|nr:glycosyltransferase family 1 protein [Steroidobacteraceae bacterium]
MLRHFDQKDGGVKVYTHSILPRLLSLPSRHHFVLIYQDPKRLGTYPQYPNCEEIAVRIPGTVLWDQVAVPWVVRTRHLDMVFNPKITIPFLSGAKKAYVVHGAEKFAIPEHFQTFDRWYFERMMPLYGQRADAVVAVTNCVKADVVRHLHVDPKKVFVIYNGFDSALFHRKEDPAYLRKVAQRYQLPDRFILWAGQIESRKNLPRLLQAFAKLRLVIPHHLVLAGAQRANYTQELRAIRELGLEDRILMPGWISHEDLAALYSLAELFVFPSLHEGFGIPLVEAMACGCPIVAANTGSVPEVVDQAACLVDPLQPDEIAGGIQRVLADATLRAELSAKGLERAKIFSWDKTARQVLDMLDSLDELRHAA